MVDLPSQPDRLVTTEAPQSRISASEVANSGEQIARGLSKVGQGLEDVGVPIAEEAGTQAGQQAVTRNADGSLNVTNPASSFIFNPRMAAAFQKSANDAVMPALRTQVDVDLNKMRQDYGDNPPELMKQAGIYTDALRARFPGAIGQEAWTYAQQVASQHYDGAVDEVAGAHDKAARNAIAARRGFLEDQMDGLAFQPGGTESRQFQQLRAEHDQLGQQIVDNPLNGYSADQKKVDDAQLDARLGADAAAGHARATYQKTGNLTQAQQEFDDAIEKLPLSAAEKLRYTGMITSHLIGANAIMQQRVQDLKDQGQSLVLHMRATGQVDDAKVENLARQLESAKGGMAAAADLRGAALSARASPAIIGGTAAEATAAIGSIYSQALRENGTAAKVPLTAAQRDDVIRTVYGEAGGEADVGQAGVAHVIKTRALSGRYGNDVSAVIHAPAQFSLWNAGDPAGSLARGLSPSDPKYQAIGQIVDGVFGGTIPDPTGGADHYYNPHLASPDWGQQLAAQNDVTIGNHRFVGGSGDVETARQTAYRVAIKELQGSYDAHVQRTWSGIADAYTKGFAPTPGELADLRTMMPYLGDDSLRQTIADTMSKEAAKQVPTGLPLQAQQDAVAIANLAAQKGEVDPIGRKALPELAQEVQHKTDLAKGDPVTYGQRFIPAQVAAEHLPPVNPLDMTSPQSLQQGLRARQAWLGATKSMEPQAASMPLTGTDREQLANMLPQSNGQQAGMVLGTLASTLKPDELNSVVNDKGINSAIMGLTHSGDAGKMGAAFSFLDGQYRANPIAFQQAFGGDAFKDLRKWQTLGSFLPPDQLASRMMQADDPSTEAARQTLRDQADKQLERLTGPDVVKQMTQAHAPVLGFGVPFTGAGEVASENPSVAGAALANDYRAAYKDYYGETGDANNAAKFAGEKLSLKYGASPSNGGRLMAYPPERYYPPVNGATDYIGRQLDADVRQSVGDMGTEADRLTYLMSGGKGDKGGDTQAQQEAAARFYAPRALVPDAGTEADIAAGRPPSYQVVIQDKSGLFHRLEASPGQALRFRADPAAAQSGLDAQFLQDRRQDAARMQLESQRREAIKAGRPPFPMLGAP